MITDKQRELRKGSIGSSDAAVVLGVDNYRNRYDLWLEKTGRTEGFSGNASTERGEYLEDGILRWAANKLNDKVVKPSNSFVYTTAAGTVLRAHVDGQVGKYGKGQPIVEAKNMVVGEWGSDGSEDIPLPVYVQVQHQMLCSESSEAYVARLSTHSFTLHPVDADPEIQRAIIEHADFLWQTYIATDTPPPLDGKVSDSTLQYLQRSFKDDGTATVIDEENMQMFDHWKQVEDDAKERAKYHKALIVQQMGSSKRGSSENFECTMVRGGGGRILDQNELKTKYPKTYEKCLKESAVYHYPKVTPIKKG